MITIRMILVQKARKSGGDKYAGTIPTGQEVTFYVPQFVSRYEGGVHEEIDVTITPIVEKEK